MLRGKCAELHNAGKLTLALRRPYRGPLLQPLRAFQ